MAGSYKRKYYNSSKKKTSAATFKRKVAKIVKNVVHQETKYYDIEISSPLQPVSNGGTIVAVSDVAQGDTIISRQGNLIYGKNISCRLDIKGNSINDSNVFRCLLVMDKYNQGTAPTVADVLATTGDERVMVAPQNIKTLARYRILYDKVVSLPNQTNYTVATATSSGVGRKTMSFFRKLNQKIRFKGATAADIYGQQLFLILIGDTASNDVTVSFFTRLAFTDS